MKLPMLRKSLNTPYLPDKQANSGISIKHTGIEAIAYHLKEKVAYT